MPDVAVSIERARDFAREHRVRLCAGGVAVLWLLILAFAPPGYRQLWLLLLLPLVIGATVPLAASSETTAAINGWRAFFERRLSAAQGKDGKIAQYFLRPLFAGTLRLWSATESLSDEHVRAGLRLAGLLFFWAVMLALFLLAIYIVVVIVVMIAIIALIGWFLSQNSSDSEPLRTGPGRRLREKTVRTSDFFSKDVVRVDEDGKMRAPTFAGEEVGSIDDDGTIYDASFFPERIGRIDEDGKIYSGRDGWSETEVGEIDEDGRVTEGTFPAPPKK